ncbi:MAG: response regulator [Candidatus Eremiobacterota bacterium]
MTTLQRGGLLLVDDDANYPFLMRQAFAKEGWEEALEVASDGHAAQRVLERVDPLPRLVLCDLKLPGLAGPDLLLWIRSHPRLRRLPVIMHSWVTNEEDVGRVHDLGANAFVQKPMSFDALRRLVRVLVTYWLVYNRPAW